MNKLEELLTAWNDPLGVRTMTDAEDLIHELLIEVAAKSVVIKVLTEDLQYYRKDWKDQMIQDQGRAPDRQEE